jgi:hypothetical protein
MSTRPAVSGRYDPTVETGSLPDYDSPWYGCRSDDGGCIEPSVGRRNRDDQHGDLGTTPTESPSSP